MKLKLKDTNDVIQRLVEDSFRELSTTFSEVNKAALKGHNAFFSFWINKHFKDKEGSECVRGVVDFAITDGISGKVLSFKKLLDRVLILRKNEGTIEQPKLGKQQGYEELRRTILHEVVGKGVSSLALGLVEKTKEEIEEFNQVVVENQQDELSLNLTEEDVHNFEDAIKRGEVTL